MQPLELWDLPQRLARAVHDFVFHPSLHLHPDRASETVPSHLPQPSSAASSLALMGQLGLTTSVPLELDRPLHRLALLPPRALELVAHHAAWLWHATDLRRVVLKAEIEALIVHLKIDAQEFDRLWLQTPMSTPMSTPLSTPSASVVPASARLPIGDLLNRLPRIGWELIEAVCGSLPSPIAQRLMLKLPKTGAHPVTDESTASPSSVVGVAYDLAVTHWDPQWEKSWGEVLTHVPGQRT